MDSDLPTLSLPLSLCQLLDLMGVLQFLPLQVNQSSFDITFFPGHHRPHCVSIWCVCMCLYMNTCYISSVLDYAFLLIYNLYTTLYVVKCTSFRCTVWRIFTYVSPIYNYHPDQDIEHFHYPIEFCPAPFQLITTLSHVATIMTSNQQRSYSAYSWASYKWKGFCFTEIEI